MKTRSLLTGTTPPQILSSEQLAERARSCGFSAQRLANEVHLTPRTFERRFHAAFGCTPRDWLAQQRVRHGIALLQGGWSTKEVAAALGFRDRSSLFREFRHRFGCTPRACLEVEHHAVWSLPEPLVVSQMATPLSQMATRAGLPRVPAL